MSTPQQTPGGQREDTALAVGVAVGAIMAALQAGLIALVARSVARVIAGAPVATVERGLRTQASAMVAHASAQAHADLTAAGEKIVREATEALSAAAARPVALPPAPPARTVPRPVARRPVPERAEPARTEPTRLVLTPVEPPKLSLPVPTGLLPTRPAPPAPPVSLGPLGPRRTEPAPFIPEPRRGEHDRFRTPSVDRSMTSVADSIRQAGLNALRDTDDIFRQAAEHATANHATGTQAAQKMLDELAEHGITAFTDSRGREWDLPAYTEMATRTAATRLSLLTQLQLMGPAGMDLVVVDAPSGEPGCRRCAPYEGRVLSLSGRHTVGELVSVVDADRQRRQAPVVASLRDAVAAGLLHPNCRHYLLPFVNGAASLPLVGGVRGFERRGHVIYRPVPAAHDSASYAAQQRQRVLERAVRAAAARQSVALTPSARAKARRELGVARTMVEQHVSANGLTRQRYREHPTKAR